jgi:hypothetical protein
MRVSSFGIRSALIELSLVCFCTTGPAVADTISETEPNDTVATANLTYGFNTLAILGTLSPATDQDFFSFVIAGLGVPNPPFSTGARIAFTNIPNDYHFALIDPSGNTLISANFIGPQTIDFNPNAVGGIGTYTIQIGAISPSSVGPYQLSIVGVADGGGRPPVIVGSGSINGPTSAIGIPTISNFGLLLLAFVLISTSAAILRRPSVAVAMRISPLPTIAVGD